jgi:hypothetical protein
MCTSHTDAHLPEIGNFLSLEAVQVSLDRRARILEILCREMERVLELYTCFHKSDFLNENLGHNNIEAYFGGKNVQAYSGLPASRKDENRYSHLISSHAS